MIKQTYLKYQEIINYLIIGVMTTLISLITYFLLVHTVLEASNAIELQIANIISWIVSVSFAYITNRIIVFKSKDKKIIKEIIKFFSTRVITLLLDILIMYVFVTILGLNDTIIKLISQVIIIIGNYVLSKILVFVGDKSEK